MKQYKIINVDRACSFGLGGMPSDNDFCRVYERENHKGIMYADFTGTLKEAHDFLRAQLGDEYFRTEEGFYAAH